MTKRRPKNRDAFFGVWANLGGAWEAPRVFRWDDDLGSFWSGQNYDMDGPGEHFSGLGVAQSAMFGSRDKHEAEMWASGFAAALTVLARTLGDE